MKTAELIAKLKERIHHHAMMEKSFQLQGVRSGALHHHQQRLVFEELLELASHD